MIKTSIMKYTNLIDLPIILINLACHYVKDELE